MPDEILPGGTRPGKASAWTLLGPGGEFDIVRRMAARWGVAAAGGGDDAAVLDIPVGSRLVASTDTSLEGVHFRRDWITDEQAAYRSTVAALSDLAAMAASPVGLLAAVTIPGADLALVDALADGIGRAAVAARCPIVGGDLTHGASVCLTITVLGSSPAPVLRSGARPGDHLYVTGRLGGPAAAVRALMAKRAPDPTHMARFTTPAPRIEEATWLQRMGITAAIDISDGLSSEAGHLAAASGAHLSIDLDQVPCVQGVTAMEAAAGGEEYELLVAAPDELDTIEFESRFGVQLTRIGSVGSGPPGATFSSAGMRVDLSAGYDHFSR